MSTAPHHERDLRALLGAEIDPARYEAALERALRAVDVEIARTQDRRRPQAERPRLAPRVSRRALVVLVVALLAMTAVAVAREDVRRFVFGAPDKPANRVEQFQERDLSGLGISSLGEPLDPGDVLAIALSGVRGVDREAWGVPRFDHARLLLEATIDGARVRVAAVPTERGNVCVATAMDGMAVSSCASRFDADHPARFGTSSHAGRLMVAGLLSDEVRAVRILLPDGRVEPATSVPNAFAWVGDVRPVCVVIELLDGTERRFDEGGPPA